LRGLSVKKMVKKKDVLFLMVRFMKGIVEVAGRIRQ
jgi:hypothetical protein